MITDTVGTFTYTETDFSLNVSLATDGEYSAVAEPPNLLR
mgnify:CR=1 FL=1